MTEPRGGVNAYLAQISEQLRELREAQEQFRIERQRQLERLRGVKIVRLPKIQIAGANPLNIPADQPPGGMAPVTPEQGWVWSLKRLVITGMTRGATPDVLQVLRGTEVIWELNGNQYAQTWGNGEMEFNAGEALGFQSVGTFAATGQIIIRGSAWEVPGPEIGKLL